jgi:hypothetical protein
MDIEALAKEVRYLRDRRDIEDCIHRYCRGLDRLDRELALSAYHPGATDDRGPHVGTAEAFMDWVFPELAKWRGTAHSITNISVEIDGDVAHAESYITYHTFSSDERGVIFGMARYIDRLERRDGRWAIAHREALIDHRSRLEALPMRPTVLTGRRDKQDRSYARPFDITEDARQRMAKRTAEPPPH